MRQWFSVFPIVGWLSSYKKDNLSGDVFAGLTVGALLIPQGMAYALVAGLPPVYGLYASIIPTLTYAFLGTSRQLSVAPVAMDSLLVAAGISVLASEGTASYVAYAILLAAMVGLIQLLLGLFKLGFITNLLSKPVISGFTSAAAILIAFSQLGNFLGVEMDRSSLFYELILSLMSVLKEIEWLTFSMGAGAIMLIVLLKRVNSKLPAAFFTVIIGIVLVQFFSLHEWGVAIIGNIPQGLPSFGFPDVSFERITSLLPLAATIALVGYMEAFSVAKAMESKNQDHRVYPNQELIALGASNLLGSFFQSFPVTGGFSRSAVNDSAGAKTPISSIVSVLLIVITLLFFTSLFYFLPKAILAAMIMVAVFGLIDFKYARQLFLESKLEFALLIITFLITLNVGMVAGILSGIIASILLLLFKSAYPHIAELGRIAGHHEFRNVKRFPNLETWENMLIVRVDATLTFINIQYFKDYIDTCIKSAGRDIQIVILDAGPMSYIDASACSGLAEFVKKLKEQNIDFLMCDLIGPVRDTMQNSIMKEVFNDSNVFIDLNEAVKYATTHEQGDFKSYALQHQEKG